MEQPLTIAPSAPFGENNNGGVDSNATALESVITQVQQPAIPNVAGNIKNRYQKYSKRLERHRRSSISSRDSGGGAGAVSDESDQAKLNSTPSESPIGPSSPSTEALAAEGSMPGSVANNGRPTNRLAAMWSTIFACCVPALRTLGLSKQSASDAKLKAISADGEQTPAILATSVDVSGGNRAGDASKPAKGTNALLMRSPPMGPRGPTNPPRYLLRPPLPEEANKKCLVLDLDETLIHSSFKPVPNPDWIIPVEIDNQIHHVYVLKRPYVDEFLRRMGLHFEVVLFTASLSKYADPVTDVLDKNKVIRHRLFREACCNHRGNFVKDLSQLGRDLKNVIIIDNSPISYMFHPTNAVPITSWFNDANDAELLDLIPFLEDLTMVDNVMTVLDSANAEEDDENEDDGRAGRRRR